MTKLNNLFPIIQSEKEVLSKIDSDPLLAAVFRSWPEKRQREFLNICTGMKGHRILYDVYFKYVFNAQTHPEHLKGLLESLLDRKIDSLEVMDLQSALIAEAHPLMVLDILVRLDDGAIVNVEIQKIGYKFPGQRAACYSADLVLRQYARLKKEDKKAYYGDMNPVYTVVLIEESTLEFHEHDAYIHHFTQQTDTGLTLPLLQEYYFVPLDNFREAMHNKSMKERTRLEAWLTFLTAEEPDEINSFVLAFPEFKEIYLNLYMLCRNVEGAMKMFSEQLSILDRNTTTLMIDELRDEVKAEKSRADAEKNRADAAKKEAEAAREDACLKQKRIEELEKTLQKLYMNQPE